MKDFQRKLERMRKIAIFTGSRAEYGLLYSVIKAVDIHPGLQYGLLVAGSHLDSYFGTTLNEIQNDGFCIYAELGSEINTDSQISTALAIGNGILSMSRVLNDICPDMVVVYGDRFEAFAAVIASTQMNIPTVHIEGGDLTEGGALDDSVRHSMTKLAHLHFTTNQQSTNRILAMGEEPWRVHTVGLPVLDMITMEQFAQRPEIIERLSLDLARPVVICTQHSVTTEIEQAVEQFAAVLNALRRLAADGVQVIITYPNNDAGGRAIIYQLEVLELEKISGIQIHRSLGRHLYHGVLALARDSNARVVCVGNSSSGIKETSAFGCPAVNVGSRQQGRLRSINVIDTAYDTDEIEGAVHRCLSDDAFRYAARNCNNPYYFGGVGVKVAEVLASIQLDHKLLRKSMTLKGEVLDGWYR